MLNDIYYIYLFILKKDNNLTVSFQIGLNLTNINFLDLIFSYHAPHTENQFSGRNRFEIFGQKMFWITCLWGCINVLVNFRVDLLWNQKYYKC